MPWRSMMASAEASSSTTTAWAASEEEAGAEPAGRPARPVPRVTDVAVDERLAATGGREPRMRAGPETRGRRRPPRSRLALRSASRVRAPRVLGPRVGTGSAPSVVPAASATVRTERPRASRAAPRPTAKVSAPRRSVLVITDSTSSRRRLTASSAGLGPDPAIAATPSTTRARVRPPGGSGGFEACTVGACLFDACMVDDDGGGRRRVAERWLAASADSEEVREPAVEDEAALLDALGAGPLVGHLRVVPLAQATPGVQVVQAPPRVTDIGRQLAVARVGGAALHHLVLQLRPGAERRVEDHDRVQPGCDHRRRHAQLVVPLLHHHVGLGPMADLRRQRHAEAVARGRLAQRHPLVPPRRLRLRRLRLRRLRRRRRHQVHRGAVRTP